MLWLKIGMILNLGCIFYQDIKKREVLWFLFPLLAVCIGSIHLENSVPVTFLISVGMNITIIVFIMGVLYGYARYILKKSLFKEAFGIGDALFFIAFAIGFPTITFVVLFVFSLIFSSLLTLVFQRSSETATVPLAGYMSLFLILIFGISWSINEISLYLI